MSSSKQSESRESPPGGEPGGEVVARRAAAPVAGAARADRPARGHGLMTLLGVDFTSAPSRRKPITAARGWREGQVVYVEALEALDSLNEFAEFLAQPGPWVGAFDFPFGLPRELVDTLSWPRDWATCMSHFASQPRERLREQFAAFCAGRPAGAKFAHRACDVPAGSSPSMKWVNPPVAWMMHAGVPRLREAGVTLAGLQRGDPQRVALEGYPGLLAREVLGRRSYKSDTLASQTPERLQARDDLLNALEHGRTRLGLHLALLSSQRHILREDPRGDRLDAVLCLMQAAWAVDRPRHGLPEQVDPLEGWIVTA